MKIPDTQVMGYGEVSIIYKASIRVSLITPTSCDKAAHLPNWAPWGKNQPKIFFTKFSDFVKKFWG